MPLLKRPWQKLFLSIAVAVLLATSLFTVTTLYAQEQLTTACDADLTQDGFVNLMDYTVLAQNLTLLGEPNLAADINHDNQVNLLDYSALASHFFQSCIPDSTPSPAPSSTPMPSPIGMTPAIGGCSIFPADNPWNQDISQAPVHPLSSNYVTSIGAHTSLHPDMGGAAYGELYGIPFITVTASQPKLPITFSAYGDESDQGPYPIPLTAPIEGGSNSDGDRHVIALETTSCTLFELYRAFPGDSGWTADSGAVFDLKTNYNRPKGWTSADAAGLPILPGLVRYDEVAAGEVRHAIRFTAPSTQRGYIFPARHFASSSTDANRPPMGLRLRLKASYNTSGLSGQALVIANAMKKYGIILADNGSSWYFQGDTNANWNDDQLNQLKQIKGSDFEAVYTGEIEQ